MSLRTVYVPVPAEHADEVSAFVDRLESRADPSSALDGPDDPGAPDLRAMGTVTGRRRHNGGGTVWRPQDYEKFRRTGNPSYQRVRAFMEVLAARPEEALPTSEVTALSGITDTQIRAALGKFTRWIGVNLGTSAWPFGWAYGHDVDPANPSEFHYTMSAEQAAAWQASATD